MRQELSRHSAAVVIPSRSFDPPFHFRTNCSHGGKAREDPMLGKDASSSAKVNAAVLIDVDF